MEKKTVVAFKRINGVTTPLIEGPQFELSLVKEQPKQVEVDIPMFMKRWMAEKAQQKGRD